jgi:peptidase E
MPPTKGIITLMGSGEFTATMVEVHKGLLTGLPQPPRAVFLDTPAGFQLNADQLSEKAADYFRRRILHPLGIASFKSKEDLSPLQAEQAFHALREADYILIGPGSPTYALRHWQGTPIPDLFVRRIEQGACLVAASAAALTVGKFTLPVYEIYKVGQELYWAEGLDILGRFGFQLVVIPHWNNAEGGTHDTRFCYLGEPRLKKLEALLPKGVSILGLDEHTACLIDFDKKSVTVKGIGQVVLRQRGEEKLLTKGVALPLEVLSWEDRSPGEKPPPPASPPRSPGREEPRKGFWEGIHTLEAAFDDALNNQRSKDMVNALLDLDHLIWKGLQEGESEEFIIQAREGFRDRIVFLGSRLESRPVDENKTLQPLIEALVALRESFRREKLWKEADALRACLQQAGIILEDTQDGPQWRIQGD